MANPSYSASLDRHMGGNDPIQPARYATPVTPSDTVGLSCGPAGTYAKRLYVASGGSVNLIAAGDNGSGGLGTAVLYAGVQSGGYINCQVRAVLNTGTTAGGIVAESD